MFSYSAGDEDFDQEEREEGRDNRSTTCDKGATRQFCSGLKVHFVRKCILSLRSQPVKY